VRARAERANCALLPASDFWRAPRSLWGALNVRPFANLTLTKPVLEALATTLVIGTSCMGEVAVVVVANVAFTDPEHLTRTLRHGLALIQRRPHLIDGCLKETGLQIAGHHPAPPRKGQ
jgi:hypothetical protein